MSGPRFVAFAGSWNQPSKTRKLVAQTAEKAVARFGGSAHIFDVADLGPDFAAIRDASQAGDVLRGHLAEFVGADALIVASPVYKGSYTGLFKHFIDLIDPTALIGKPVLLAATGGGDRHALVIEHQLRPLFGFFETNTLATGFYASPGDFDEGRLVSEVALARLDRAIEQFGPHLKKTPPASGLRSIS